MTRSTPGLLSARTLRAAPSLDRTEHQEDQALARLGYRVLRLEAELVVGQPLEVLARIREALAHSR